MFKTGAFSYSAQAAGSFRPGHSPHNEAVDALLARDNAVPPAGAPVTLSALALAAGDYVVFVNTFPVEPDGSYPYQLTVTCGGCTGDCNGDHMVQQRTA